MEVSAIATPVECYARVAHALAELRKYLVPHKNDEIAHEQMLEMNEHVQYKLEADINELVHYTNYWKYNYPSASDHFHCKFVCFS